MPRPTSRIAAALAATMVASALMAGPATATTPTPSTPSTTAPASPALDFRNSCSPRWATLPAAVEGSPKVRPGDPTGLYLWHDKKGWHMRLTHNLARSATTGKPQTIEIRGRITTSKAMAKVRTVRLEDRQAGEWVSVQRPHRKVTQFRFVNAGFIDGINLTAGCAGKVSVNVWQVTRGADGKAVRTALPVFVGKDRIPASSASGVLSQVSDTSQVTVLRRPLK